MPRPADRAGDVLRTNGLLDPDRILAAEPAELAGEEWLEREVAAILLADEDDERRPVDARGCERAHRIAQARGGVEEGEAGSPRPIAQPVARPTTEPSCRPSTKRRSSGKSVRNGTSVEPGLPKIVVRPCSRRTSNVASRTVSRSRRAVSRVPKFGMRTSVHMETTHGRNPDYVQSLERGLAVIRAFGVESPELRLSDVARATSRARRRGASC